MSLEQSNIVELTDENGNPVKFEHIDTIEHEGENYVLLLPTEPLEGMDDEDEMGVVILKIVEGDEEDEYHGVEDEALLDIIFEKYLEMEAEEDDFDE